MDKYKNAHMSPVAIMELLGNPEVLVKLWPNYNEKPEAYFEEGQNVNLKVSKYAGPVQIVKMRKFKLDVRTSNGLLSVDYDMLSK